LSVFADLDFVVDLGDGPVQGRVEAAGSTIRVTTDDAVAVWRAAFGVPEFGGDALPRLADQLAAAGLRLEVTGPRGSVAVLGEVTGSLLGRLASGSAHVGLGSLRAVAPLAIARVRRNERRLLLPALAAAAVLLAMALNRRSGR
jgi:hypothetical protein